MYLSNAHTVCQEWIIADVNHDGTSGTVDLFSKTTLENSKIEFCSSFQYYYAGSNLDDYLEYTVYDGFDTEIKNALNIFKTKIKFTYEPIPEIFGEISKNTNYNISKLFKQATENMKDETASFAWEKAVDEFSGNLNKEDKQAIKTLSKLLRDN